nr:hypothetical protein Iba_chr04bCG2180 [Ipomoea batatas]GMC87683.1 hypothetical protein Iba_chr04eCG2830 [Ipomoea batatas]
MPNAKLDDFQPIHHTHSQTQPQMVCTCRIFQAILFSEQLGHYHQ